MMSQFVTLAAVAAAFLQSPLSVLGQSPLQFFQLVSEDNTCLQMESYYGGFAPCVHSDGGFSPYTVYLLNSYGTVPGVYNVEVFGTGLCLDREHCHSSTSNLRYSDCGHCGAIHWSINRDGSVREDSGQNCIYKDSSGQASVHHCFDGFEKFKQVLLGNQFLLKSKRHGDCVAGDKFANCDTAPTFYTTDLPENYKIHSSLASDLCLDREHCHSSTSNVRLYNCTHCGAIHWSIASTNKVGEDQMQNCVNRDADNATLMKHCTEGYEEIYHSIIPNKPPVPMQSAMVNSNIALTQFPNPNVADYLRSNLSRIRGAKLFKQGKDACAIEIVHYLETPFQYGQYRGEYIIAHLNTSIYFDGNLTFKYVMNTIAADSTQVTLYSIRYGMTDDLWKNFGYFDGLYSLFVTNTDGVLVTDYTSATINHLVKGIQAGTYNWDEYYVSVYPGEFDLQMHYDLFDGYSPAALYWSHSVYSSIDESKYNRENKNQL